MGVGVDEEGLPATIGRHVVQSIRDGLVVRILQRGAAATASLGVDLIAVVIGEDRTDEGD